MSDCTIIIPTYNRPGYLKRLLSYYKDFHIPYNIIITDGSSEDIKKANRETVSLFDTAKILHLDHYPHETGLYERLFDAAKQAGTKYSVICADDDFITPNGLIQSVAFLEANPDYSVAHGKYIGFRREDNKRGEKSFYWTNASSAESIIFDDPAKRLLLHLSEYDVPTFYAVHKTELLKMMLEETLPFVGDYVFSELLPSMLALIYGKMKCLDSWYYARNAGSVRLYSVPSMLDYMRKGTYKAQYALFRKCLATHLSRQAQLNLETSGEIVDKAMEAYMSKYNSKVNLSTRVGYFLDYLKLPKTFRNCLRWLYTALAKTKHDKKSYQESLPTQAFDNELDQIKLYVLSNAGNASDNS
jgi:glycosyltransferase domain-containing protein